MGVRSVLEKWSKLHIVPIAAMGAFLEHDDPAPLMAALSIGDATKPVSRVEWWLIDDLLATLPRPPELSDADRRVLALCALLERRGRGTAGKEPLLLAGQWLGGHLVHEPAGQNWLGIVLTALDVDVSQSMRVAWGAVHAAPATQHSATRFLVSLPESELVPLLLAGATGIQASPILTQLARAAPERLPWALRTIWPFAPPYARPMLAALALATGIDAVERAVLELHEAATTSAGDLTTITLAARFPDRAPPPADRIHGRILDLARAKKLAPDALDGLIAFLSSGDEASLAKVPRVNHGGYLGLHDEWLGSALTPQPNQLHETELRLVVALTRTGGLDSLIRWVNRSVSIERPGDDAFTPAIEVLRESGVSDDDIVDGVARHSSCYTGPRGPTSLGRWAASLQGDELRRFVTAQLTHTGGWAGLTFLAQHVPDRLDDLSERIEATRSSAKAHGMRELCKVLMRSDAARFRPLVATLAADSTKLFTAEEAKHSYSQQQIRGTQVELRRLLAAYDAAELPAARAAALASVAEEQSFFVTTETPLQWLARTFGSDVVPDLCAIAQSVQVPHHKVNVSSFLADAFGTNAPPALAFLLESEIPFYRLHGLLILAETLDSAHDGRFFAEIERLLDDKNHATVIAAIDLAVRFHFAWIEPRLWKLLGHKAARVRSVAARVLTNRRKEDSFDLAAKLLAHKQAAMRLGAIELVRLLDSTAALPLLEARLDVEPSEDVRDEILLAVRDAWKAAGRTIRYADVEKRFARASSKDPLAPWLDVSALPPIVLASGERLPREGVEWMLRRQARVRGVRLDLEAEALYALVDRSTSGDFALHVLERFLAADAAAEESWALVIAGVLGDDRVVARLVNSVHSWVKDRRVAFAEYGVHSLAFQGSDAALLAIDALGFKYATKPKNVGDAAIDAFNAAAERRDMTPDELRDRVVPWLGFDPGRPLVIDGGGKSIEVAVTLDFELAFTDARTGKVVKSIPKTAPHEVAADIKEKKELLKHVAKAQTLRLENLLVVGHVWSASLFDERFLKHPLLLPFAVRLVWASVDEHGNRTIFRAKDARTLVDVDGNLVALSPMGNVHILHPLELDEATVEAWKTHLSAGRVVPPFAQLERPVFRVDAADRDATAYRGAVGITGEAQRMKSTTERLAWRRGHTNGGFIEQYVKSFGLAGIVAHLNVDDMHVVLDLCGTPKLGELTFEGKTAPGRLPLRDVPENVYSETLADLQKIAGKALVQEPSG